MPLYPGPQGPQGASGSSGAQGPQGAAGSAGSTGSQGAQGAQGAQGVSPLPIGRQLSGSWQFDPTSQAASAPGDGKWRLNHATQTSATALYIDNDDSTPTDRSAEIDAWDDSTNSNPKGYLFVADSFAPASNGQLLITITGAVVNSTGYRTIPVTVTNPNSIALTAEPTLFIFTAVGNAGAQGPQGFQGATGTTGSQGPQGTTGTTGSQGAQGAQGTAGSTGAQGAQGAAGSTGAQGFQGAAGGTGAQGAQGAQGATGSNFALGRSKHGGNVDYQFPGAALGATSTLAYSAGTLVYWFMHNHTTVTYDQMAVNVTTGPASNANIRCGIYAADTDFQPSGAALVDVTTAVATSFTGVKTLTISSGGQLAAGRYLVAFNCDVNMTLRTWRGMFYTGFVDNSLGGSTAFVGGSVASAYGALPTNVPWTAVFSSVGDHSVLLRVGTP